jgi:multisubunit Na+/H+ antiporter MnhE subunit
MERPRQIPIYVFFLAQLVVLAIFWFLFTGTLSWNEAAVGVGGVLATLLAALRLRAMKLASFQPRAEWFAPVLSLPKQVVLDSISVTRALWRRAAFGEDAKGKFSTVPFPGKGDDPRQTARKALVIMETSLPPNSFILGIDAEKDLLLYHELAPQPKPPEPVTKLGAE